MVNTLIEARDEKRLLRYQKALTKVDLLIVDELGFVPLSKTGAELLFEVFSQRHELVCDQDTKFTDRFDAVFKGEGMEVVRTSRRAPEMNPFAETFVKTLKYECLNHFTVFGYGHLMHLLSEFSVFYNNFRPHRNRDNRPLAMIEPPRKDGAFSLDDRELNSCSRPSSVLLRV